MLSPEFHEHRSSSGTTRKQEFADFEAWRNHQNQLYNNKTTVSPQNSLNNSVNSNMLKNTQNNVNQSTPINSGQLSPTSSSSCAPPPDLDVVVFPNKNSRRRSSLMDIVTFREPIKSLSKDKCLKQSDLEWARKNGVAYLQSRIESTMYFKQVLSKFDKETLTRIYCGENSLQELPEEIYTFLNLDTLAVENNKLQHIPSAIGKLKKLRVLYVNENCLKQNSFPSSMQDLSKLTTLWLQGNKLKTLPTELCFLTNLRYLNAGQNRIKSVSTLFYNLRRLKALWLNDNLLESIPNEILQIVIEKISKTFIIFFIFYHLSTFLYD